MSIVGFSEVAYVDCAGGGQIYLDGTTAYVGHMENPAGTSIYDVADPKHPKLMAELSMPEGTHSHKVRVIDGIMVVNHEKLRKGEVGDGFVPGAGIYDVSNPAKPKAIGHWDTVGSGVHRFDFDGDYAYLSSTVEGCDGAIVVIVDMSDPAKPTEVGRWWSPGQWTAGGETVADGAQPPSHCHHPLRMGDRLYTSYWQGGFHILDVSDITEPKTVCSVDYSPPFVCPTHTCLPIPFDIKGRKYMFVADEDVARTDRDGPAAFVWMFDITDETNPVPVSTYQIEELIGKKTPDRSGAHQPSEKVTGTEIPVTWFTNGLRLLDISNPHAMKEIGHFNPPPANGERLRMSNDVTTDDRGLFYLLDRFRGFHILERT